MAKNQRGDSEIMAMRDLGINESEISADMKLKVAKLSVNTARIPDEQGKFHEKFPTMRDADGKMQFERKAFREVDVPPDQVLIYTQSPLSERNTGFSASIDLGGDRKIIVFDRAYRYNGKVYFQCAWEPNKAVRAGLMYEKKIHQQSKKPIAVLRKAPGQVTPLYQIIGGKEPDYRELKRVFEQVFIKKGGPVPEDDELNQFMYDANPAIPAEEV